MFFDINKALCDTFQGLDPIKLLDYPAEDVFDLINGLISHNERKEKAEGKQRNRSGGKETVIRRQAGDDWF